MSSDYGPDNLLPFVDPDAESDTRQPYTGPCPHCERIALIHVTNVDYGTHVLATMACIACASDASRWNGARIEPPPAPAMPVRPLVRKRIETDDKGRIVGVIEELIEP
jgi:hypothetical protein